MLASEFIPSVASLSVPLGVNWNALFELSGVMHPAVSHFPIALLTVAGLVEGWSVFRGHKKPASATLVCLVIGTIAAIVATVLGWADGNRMGFNKDETFNLHRLLGIAVAVIAVVALVMSVIVQRADSAGRKVIWAYRANVFAAAGLVGLVGSLGGKLVHGETYYSDAYAEFAAATGEKVVNVAQNVAEEGASVATKVVEGAADAIHSVPAAVEAAVANANAQLPAAPPTTGPAPDTGVVATVTQPTGAPAAVEPAATQPASPTTAPGAIVATAPPSGVSFGGGRIDFARDIQPIFEANCVKCHSEKKSKGDYRLDTVKHLFAAGSAGVTPIVPGKSDESLLIKMLEGKGEYEDSIMPPKGDPLTFQQIALIRRWIDEGAHPGATSTD